MTDTKVVLLLFFSGTYDTIWAPPYPTDDNGDELLGDLDFGLYMNYISHGITLEVDKLLPFADGDVVFQSCHVPKEYNSVTDTIIVTLKNYRNNINYLRGYAAYHKKYFQKYLNSNFKSCDGFISYYSDNYDFWAQQYSEDLDEVEVGTYLSFYLISEVSVDLNEYIFDSVATDVREWVSDNFTYESE
jgi:hypothetical protein